MSTKHGSADSDILDYLTAQNRPFSVNDIVNNLHNEHGKSAAQNSLDKLVKAGKVCEKTYGKQKVYVVNQDNLKEATAEEINSMEKKIGELENHIKDSESRLKEAQMRLKELTTSLTTEEARIQVSKLRQEVEELKVKHKMLSGKTIKIDAKERAEIIKKRNLYISQWRSRKRRCMDMISTIMDSYPKKKEDLYEELGVETDEDVAAIIPK